MKIPNAIILIEACGNEIIGIHAFTNDEDGRADAKDLFTEIAKQQEDASQERCFTNLQIAQGWDEGWISDMDSGVDAWSLSFHTAES